MLRQFYLYLIKFGGIMNKFLIVILALSSFTLVACNDQSTPENTVKTAYKFLSKGKEANFYSTLTSSALEKFGNPAGMTLLKDELIKYPNFQISPAQLTSRKVIVDTPRRKEIISNYILNITSAEQLIRNVSVKCDDIGYIEIRTVCRPGRYPNGRCYRERVWVEYTDCKITDIL